MALSEYQKVIHATRYARWNDAEKRRETWDETVHRTVDWIVAHASKKTGKEVDVKLANEIKTAVLDMRVQPSMRLFMTAGEAVESAPVAAYNCSFLTISRMDAFREFFYILMCGAGAGVSVERRNLDKLPIVAQGRDVGDLHWEIQPEDSREGWADALNTLLVNMWLQGLPRPMIDASLIRPSGTRLKRFGGFASGPAPLIASMAAISTIIEQGRGRSLTAIEVSDILMHIAAAVVVGGVRRSAVIILFDKDDDYMMNYKSGTWYEKNGQRALANVSAVFEEQPSEYDFKRFWTALENSGSGEPGFFNRAAAVTQMKKLDRPIADYTTVGVNPCAEILLQDQQFCNLTAAVVRPEDTLKEIQTNVRLAAMLGTMQSWIDEFPYLNQDWSKNTRKERLLGVCLTGLRDHSLLQRVTKEGSDWLQSLKETAEEANTWLSDEHNMNKSTCLTSVKPSGNSGELYNASSGVHPRYAQYIQRTIRQSVDDPITSFLQAQGVKNEISVTNPRDIVFYFAVEAPKGSVKASDDNVTSIEQLEYIKWVQNNYTDHSVSATIYVKKDEWEATGKWVFENFDDVRCLSFLPFDNSVYQQAPLTGINQLEFKKLTDDTPTIDWSLLRYFERGDTTTVSHNFACAANGEGC